MSKWLERIFIFVTGSYIGYVIMAFATDYRLDDVRPFINEKAIKVGIEAGVAAYLKEFKLDEPLRIKLRKERDQKIKESLQKITGWINEP